MVSQVKDGTTDAIRAEYQWLADGTKLSAVNAAGNGYDYVGSFIYGKSGGISTLESAPFSGGRIVKTSSGYEVNYFLTDHLGSTRVVFSQNLTDLQRNDYYPFGLRVNGLQLGNNRWLYNGKESQMSLGLSYLDYGARFYDANGVIFNRLDRFAEKYNDLTPYGYAAGNPIKYIDHNGDDIRHHGKKEDVQETFDMHMEYMGGFYNVGQGENGSMTLTHSGKEGTMSAEQSAYYNLLNTMVNDKGVVNINVVSGSQDVIIGDVNTSTIDIGDMQAMGSGDLVNGGYALMHETFEQYQVQVGSATHLGAHRSATGVENSLAHARHLDNGGIGFPRIISEVRPIIDNFLFVPVLIGGYDLEKNRVGEIVINLRNNNVTGVQSIPTGIGPAFRSPFGK